MASHRQAVFNDQPYVDPNPLPTSVPPVDELGTTSAPLKSASFFIGQYCKEVNEDFMLCKSENRDPAHCLKEGRKVTRCATELIRKMRESCLAEFDAHWQCLEKNNQYFQACRVPEKALNSCVFTKLNLTKTIPGSPEGQPQVHEKEKPIFTRVQK
ncbi:NADH dehydrogenase (ubiquinone) 1 alpha subcomplex 8 [Tremella mesenterica]|uniref:NADH-ubiquinone oxidoreductase n=1 Tax=Tremella mesenterica TaxID=5217 RepID=A0A4Q1BJ65_TREME|nr:NADH dehydrogenase (ubiquinone) 1 alpha subcomplex 8 [Tremella mesenterica]